MLITLWGQHARQILWESAQGCMPHIQGMPKNRGHFVLRPITLEILNRSLSNLAQNKSLHSEHHAVIYLNQLWKIVAPSSEWQWHFYNYKFWIGDHFVTSFQPTCLHCYCIYFLIKCKKTYPRRKWFVLFWMCDFIALTRCCKLISFLHVLFAVLLSNLIRPIVCHIF